MQQCLLLLVQGGVWEITYLQVGVIKYLCRVGFLVNDTGLFSVTLKEQDSAYWSVQQHIFAVKCFINDNFIIEVQCFDAFIDGGAGG